MQTLQAGRKLVTVSAKTLRTNLSAMRSLGSIGEEVLAEYNLTDLDKANDEKQYPYEIRSAMDKRLYERYGEIALVYLGFVSMDDFFEMLVAPKVNRAKESQKSFRSKDDSVVDVAITEFMTQYPKELDGALKKLTVGDAAEYGLWVKKISPLQWELKCTRAMEIFQEPTSRGSFEYELTRSIGNYFICDLRYLHNRSEEGYGYATWYWLLSLTKERSSLSPSELLAKKVSLVKDQLLMAVVNDVSQKQKQMESLSRQLSKYLPPQIHKSLMEGESDTEVKTRRKKMTICFCDIQDFTLTSEGLQPEDLTKYLNEYFSEMTTIATEFGATIDKYIGDAMMVFFGDTDSQGEKNDARSCVSMALAMQDRMRDLQAKWSGEGFSKPFRIRIGIHTGFCNVGNFGSDQRLTYTIIGGEVNVAQRLESSADADGILMSYETYAHARDIIEVEERDAITMKGINREIKVYSIISKRQIESEISTSTKEKITKGPIRIDVLKSEIKGFAKQLEDIQERLSSLEKK